MTKDSKSRARTRQRVTESNSVPATPLTSPLPIVASPHVQQEAGELLANLQSNGKFPAKKRGNYRPRPKPEPITLDEEFLRSPNRMNYALLLALLMRQNGVVTITQDELQHDDTQYNVLFAVSMDGKHLEVRAVSAESGIIRSPEAPQWTQTLQPGVYSAPPLPSEAETFNPYQQGLANGPIELSRHGGGGSVEMPYQPGNPESQPPQTSPLSPSNPSAQTAGQKKPEYVFPFAVGRDPQTAGDTTLEAMTAMLGKDRTIAQQEHQAAQRVEHQES